MLSTPLDLADAYTDAARRNRLAGNLAWSKTLLVLAGKYRKMALLNYYYLGS